MIKATLERLRRAAPDANAEALRLLAETDVAAAVLLTKLADGKNASEYNRLVEHRVSLLTRLRMLPPLPRGKVSDDEDLDPHVQEMRERVEREQRERLRRAGVID